MTRDRVSGAILIGLAVFMLWESRDFPFGSLHRPGPGFVPILLVLGLAATGIIIIAGGAGSGSFRLIKWPEWRHASAILAVSAFMAFALERLGFRVTLAIVLAFLIGVVERRGIVLTLVLALGGSFITYWLFNDVLRVLLPQGVLGF